MRDNKFTPRKIGVDLFEDYSEMRTAQEKMDTEIIGWAGTLTPEYLNEKYDYTSNVSGFTRTLPRWVLVTHMFNHKTHHRGQLTTLIMQLGIDPRITDIPWLPCLEDTEAA